MRAEAEHHPYWAFELNKGYPCPKHKTALQGIGPSAIHRRSWVFMDHLSWGACPASCRRRPSTLRCATSSRSSSAVPGLPAELARDVRRTIGDLRRARLAATAWPAVAGDLARLEAAIARDDLEAVRVALIPLSQATFEGKVRGRLAAADRPAAIVVGTKPRRAAHRRRAQRRS